MLGLAGCGTAPQLPPSEAVLPPDALEIALARARGDAPPRDRASHYLDALVELELRGDSDTLAEIAAEFEAARLAPALDAAGRFLFLRIAIEQALARGDATRAEALLGELAAATPAERIVARKFEARLLALSGQHRQAAIAWSEIADILDGGGRDMSDIADAIWRSLAPLNAPSLADLANSAPSAALAAWCELARDFNRALTATAQQRVYRIWRQAHPRHVAARFAPTSVRDAGSPPREIALLLPLSGDLRGAGETVRDGFLTAFLQAPPPKQTVRVYDTGAKAATAAYAQAVADGADLVVGPLDKDAVRAVAALRASDKGARPPLLALNRIDPGGAGADVLQLGLAVEDDASAIAEALALDGMERIVVFDHPSDWLARARARFVADSGAVQVVASSTLSTIDAATSVAGAVLGVDASSARHQELADLLGAPIEFTPRRRDDVDAVVALVGATQLQSLKPALAFHFAGELPVYVPSTAIRGAALGPLSGVRVCTEPWNLYPDPLRAAARAAFPDRGGNALFAIGVDGFRLANQLARLVRHGETIAGSTGMLSLGAGGRIERRLAWGVVQGGRLVARPGD